MKNLLRALVAILLTTACNNSADNDNEGPVDADSFNASEKRDVNNQNTIIYDSAGNKGDTSSYERMPGKVKDSVPQ